MIRWALAHGVFWAGRLTVSAVALLSIRHLLSEQGYRVEFGQLALVFAVCVVAMRFWLPPTA